MALLLTMLLAHDPTILQEGGILWEGALETASSASAAAPEKASSNTTIGLCRSNSHLPRPADLLQAKVS